MSVERFQEGEKLMAASREQILNVAERWLEAVRLPLETLTMAALSPDVSDDDFLQMVEDFPASLPGLLETMDHSALAEVMEGSMGAAMANGMVARQGDLARTKAGDLFLAAGGKRCGNSWISANKRCRVTMADEKWEGSPKEMQKRADAEMKNFPTLSHPASGLEMDMSQEGRRKTLSAMRHPHEFQAAANLPQIFLDSESSPPEPDRLARPGIKSFVKFRAPVRIGKADYEAEIITRENEGRDTLKFYHFRLAPEKSRR